MPEPDVEGPALAYVSTDSTIHLVDTHQCDLTRIPARERAICRALLEHALARFAALEQCEAMGLTVGKKGPSDV